MDNQILSTIFNTEIYESRIDRLRAGFVYTVVSITILFLLLTSAILLEGGLTEIYIPLAGGGAALFVYFLVRNKQLNIASWLFVGSIFLVVAVGDLIDGQIASVSLLIYAAIIILAGFLLNVQAIFASCALVVVLFVVHPSISGVAGDGLVGRLPTIAMMIAIAFFVYAYNRSALVSRLEGVDQEERERFKLARVNMSITRNAAERVDLATALDSTLDIILENYPDMYHAQVFLIDEKGIQARLTASTGEAGRRLIEQGHSLAVGSLSVIGQTTLSREPIVTSVKDKNSVHRVNQLLPETTLEASFPLIVEDKIIGALDLQSKTVDELSTNDKQTYQSLANSLALAIDSIRQFEQSQIRIEENQRLTEQTRTALREVERLNQRLIGRAWSEYTQNLGDDMGLSIDFETGTNTNYQDWSEPLRTASQNNDLVQEGNIIAVPLRLRGQAIGALEFELNSSQTLTSEDIDLLLEVSERFGLAAENTRLLEQSQRTAQRETLINQISSRFQSSQNVETTLTEAARSINETLDASKVQIRLGLPENPSKSANGHKDS